MATIIPFPVKAVSGWPEIEVKLRDGLVALAYSADVQDRIIEQMRACYKNLDINFSDTIHLNLEVGSEEQADALRAELSEKLSVTTSKNMNDLKARVLSERLNREIEMCRELGLI